MSDTLLRDLRRLGATHAPATLLPAVMAATGLHRDAYARLETELGPLFAAWSPTGLTALQRAEDEAGFEAWYRERFGRPARREEAVAPALRRALGDRVTRSGARGVAFDLGGLTGFERDVLMKALEIPRGEVRTYGWIAREIGRPGAVRAVGTALGHNPIPYLIPCHRVVRSDGTLGEYSAGGPDAKRRVLAIEGVDTDALERMARAHVRYHGSDTTHIFCFPTCRFARRVMDKHRVQFGSEAEARTRGYRPCKVCRPALTA